MADNSQHRSQVRRDKPEAAETLDDSNGSSCGKETLGPHHKGRIRGSQVSRPPSSHITRVDEEQSGADGRKSGARSVETVDRGVGPTPRPPPLPPAGATEPRVPPYISFQPFPDSRNGLLEAAYGLPYAYTHYPYHINTPLPISPSILEGRYHWPPTSPFSQHLPGLSSSPAHSEISFLSMRSPMLSGENSVTQLASRIHYEQLQRNYYHPLSSRRFSPASLSGLPLGASPFLGEYPPSACGRSLFSDVPPTPGSGSITLPGSLDSSRLTSPRASIIGGKSRKRALSHSPISDYLDIQSLTRSSEGSLQLASFLQHSSRSSSAASGSYGHLSAASVGTASPAHLILPSNPYLRTGSMGPSSLFYPHMHPLMSRQPPPVGHMLPPTPQVTHTMPKFEPQAQISTTTKEPGSSSIVSSTMDNAGEMQKIRVKKEMGSLHPVLVEDDDDDDNFGERGSHIPQEGEPDFIETNCHWLDCSREFESQEELVKHINQDHIQSNKKSFICRWQDCSREEKPFKAQYMLVVHMRRHTGEKPHRCTFEGCTKAYSRLENLKTHLRSHTGEKPYMCEFPGCTKAFSNASDRAKHQNRTHSNAKPYVCKAVGCTKRYTDPSSLRKHVKTVHGADFYANKKHKGDGSCQIKKEEPDGDHESCDANGRTEEGVRVSASMVQVSTSGRHSQDTIGSAPSSQSQPSPDSSPEVNVTYSLGPGQGHLIDEQINPGGGGLVSIDVEDEEVIIPESREVEIQGSGVLLTRRNRINVGQVLQNQLKCRINSKIGSIPSLPHIPNGSSHLDGRLIQMAVSKLPQWGSQAKVSPHQGQATGSGMGDNQKVWLDSSNTLLPTSRRESSSSTLSSYMSSMRSMGSNFSSRRSSAASQLSSRRSSGVSARLSIANSPYEYDITGNHPNSVSRRSSEESSTNIGKMSAMMQKTTLGSQSTLVVPPITGTISAGTGVPVSKATLGGLGSTLSNKCYNDRIARYFSSRPEINGVYKSTPCCTPLPHEIPDREIRRASDPVRTQDPTFSPQKNIQRFHSLTAMKPLPLPASMHNLHSKIETNNGNKTLPDNRKSASINFYLSQNGIAADTGLKKCGINNNNNNNIIDVELEEKMLEDSDDMIIPDDMKQFLKECLKEEGEACNGECSANQLEVLQEYGELDFNFDSCDLVPEDSLDLLSPSCPDGSASFTEQLITEGTHLMTGNMKLQRGFADLQQQGAVLAGSSPGGLFDQMSPAEQQVSGSCPESSDHWPGVESFVEGITASQQPFPVCCPRYSVNPQQMNGSLPHHHHPHLHPQQNNILSPLIKQDCHNMNSSTAFNNNKYNNKLASNTTVGHRNVCSLDCNDTDWVKGQGLEINTGSNSYHRMPVEAGSGGNTYLSQNNLIQHQLQQQCQADFNSSLPSSMPKSSHRYRHYSQCKLPSPTSLGDFKPHPPPGKKPPVQRQKCPSPQLQVPHISQSQIPANAKAAFQGQSLVKQEHQHVASNHCHFVSQANPMSTSQVQLDHNPEMCVNQNTLPHQQSPCSQYMSSHHLLAQSSRTCKQGSDVLSPNIPCVNQFLDMNHNIDPSQLSHSEHLQGQTQASCPVMSQNLSSFQLGHLQNIQHIQAKLSSHTPCPGQMLLPCGRNNPHKQTEMSPGCNQVTSSTDCKEPIALPFEDFMANLTSISTENLMDNIQSVSQESIVCSPVPPSMRSASRNSGRYSVLMNTSNMVVNDMSSVLTQLAEENKYLTLRQ